VERVQEAVLSNIKVRLRGNSEEMDEKDSQEKASQASGSIPTIVSATLRYGKHETMPINRLTVDTDEKFISSSLRGVDIPSSPTSRSDCSNEEEDAPLLEDDVLEKEQIHTEIPVQTSTKTSFIKPEHKIALSHFLVSELLSLSQTINEMLTHNREYFPTLPEMIDYFLELQLQLQFVPVLRFPS
jgi:hypothetical protein